jgi:LmbE family N-acetylglucosaminyl deacetylase
VSNDTVLIVAAHPDDEVLGCGGTIAKHVAEGDRVRTVFFTDGIGARHVEVGAQRESEQNLRSESATAAAAILGTERPTYLGFPDNRLDSVDLLDLVQALETVSRPIRPTIIYTHWLGDLNIDHRRVYQSVITAFRPTEAETVRQIRSFEVMSSTEWGDRSVTAPFSPTSYVDISSFLSIKLRLKRWLGGGVRNRAYRLRRHLCTYGRYVADDVYDFDFRSRGRPRPAPLCRC